MMKTMLAAFAAVLAVGFGGVFAQQKDNDSGEPNRGQEIERTEALQRALEDAEKDREKGLKLREKGDKQLRQAEEKIDRGLKMIEESAEEIRAQRARYAALAATVGDAATIEHFQKELDALEDIGKKWKDAADQAARGRDLVSAGERDRKRGRKNLARGGERIQDSAQALSEVQAELTEVDTAQGGAQ